MTFLNLRIATALQNNVHKAIRARDFHLAAKRGRLVRLLLGID